MADSNSYPATHPVVLNRLRAMTTEEQITRGVIVCPVTRQTLHATAGDTLASADAQHVYARVRGIPCLVDDPTAAARYAGSSEGMNAEYEDAFLRKQASWFYRFRTNDYRTHASTSAERRVLALLEERPTTVGLSIGGGPKRIHPRLTNLNIGPFRNVDVIGDAHRLPYADNSVDVIYCDAVFEHLRRPEIAARELARVLKPGGRSYVSTPFLQPYHGFPHHYQNFTLTGHCALFEDAGLRIAESGPCVGPVHMLRGLVGVFLANHVPQPFTAITRALWAAVGILAAPLDRLLARSGEMHVLASTTYLVAEKPVPA